MERELMVNFPVTPATLPRTPDAGHTTAWKDGEFSFRDVLDTINPLQHLPIIGSIYRWLTGDRIGAVPRLVGDTLFGGPIGLLTGVVNVALKEETGRDVGETISAQFGSDPAPTVAAVTPYKAAEAAKPAPVAAAVAPPGAAMAPKPLVQAAATPDFAATAQRRLFGAASAAMPARQLSSAPVPLQPAGIPLAHLQPGTGPLRSAVTAGNAPAAGNPPIDVSQQMLDALDRYTKLQQERNALRPGAVVDIAP